MVGKKVSAPHTHAWGAKTYHNALVCGLDELTEYEESDFEQIKIKVLFTNPTHRDMLPCAYYLDGECRFDATKCRFSHGELVLYNELKNYKEPDFTLLQKFKHPVLAKLPDRLWHKGLVTSANFTENTCKVRLEQTKKEMTCDFVDVFPICGGLLKDKRKRDFYKRFYIL